MKQKISEKTVAVVIAKNAYRQLETESRKRKLSAGEYLEMLIEMDYICNDGGEDPEEGEVSVTRNDVCGAGGGQLAPCALSVSEKHHFLLSRNAEREGRTPEEIAEMIISLSAEMLPERPISRRWFRSVVNIWGAVDPKDPGDRTPR